jgi:uncharacterized protein (TIGR00290 family)
MAMNKVIVSWSGGKDSAMALYEIQQSSEYLACALLTTLTSESERLGIHFVRGELIEAQAASIGLPLHKVFIGRNAANAEYEQAVADALAQLRDAEGIETVAFGDLFLADIRKYREELLARSWMRGIFPVWKRDTKKFVRDFIKLGFKAIVVSVNQQALDESFAGEMLNEAFLDRLPAGVDPCGERGEFHSFVFDGPNFGRAVKFGRGEISLREGHYCCDLWLR